MVDQGTWAPAPTSYAYQWYRNGKGVTGATRSTYKLTTSDRGRDITVKVTTKKIGCASGTATT
ncbi:glycoside hydrolase Chb [Streptomyces sp. LN245]|uniref:glycoside hydrolase Chb n=1 Tax=Streptomyces sp. LN245 TaxID=3112975 RepID=UPI00371574A2